MKTLLIILAALSFSASIAMAQPVTHHHGPYDNTANSLGGRYVGGGDN